MAPVLARGGAAAPGDTLDPDRAEPPRMLAREGAAVPGDTPDPDCAEPPNAPAEPAVDPGGSHHAHRLPLPSEYVRRFRSVAAEVNQSRQRWSSGVQPNRR